MEKPGKEFGVAGEGGRVVAHGCGREKDTEHRAALGDLGRDAFGARGSEDGIAELAPEAVEASVRGSARAVIFEEAEGGDAGGHGEGIAAERAGLVDGAEGSEVVHDVGASAERADG